MKLSLIPVLDLKGGIVVRAVGGRREEYAPIESQLVTSCEPRAVAAALCGRFAAECLYVADLDAISGAPPAFRDYESILATGVRIVVDAGVSDMRRAAAMTRFADHQPNMDGIIVGIESLASLAVAEEVCRALGQDLAIFSIDLFGGKLWNSAPDWIGRSPTSVAKEVFGFGVRRLIVLDLADVGGGRGPTTRDLCRQIRRSIPGIELIAGGGVRGLQDLHALEAAGCDAALVASALHDGRLVAV